MSSIFKRRNKYHAKPTVLNGLRFDSKKEAKRWSELQQLQAAGEVTDLKRQVSLPITIGGVKVCTYRADFTYLDHRLGAFVVEDAKGYQTDVFKLKWKLAQLLYPEWRFVIS